MTIQPGNSTKTWGGARDGAGRERLKNAQRRSHTAIVRLTLGEKRIIKRRARRSKMALSDWMRQTLIPETTPA